MPPRGAANNGQIGKATRLTARNRATPVRNEISRHANPS